MNQRDVQLMRSLMDSIGDIDEGGVVLIDVPSTQFVRINLILLKGLLEEMGRSGIFISVDRPHQYMVHLMRMHRIDLDNVTFIDMINRLSGDRKREQAKVGFADGPFHIGSLPSGLDEWASEGTHGLFELSECGFAMVDNIATLEVFNRDPAVKLFVNNFILLAKSHGNMMVPIVLDKERNQSLYRAAQKLCDVEIRVTHDLSNANRCSEIEIPKRISEPGFGKEEVE
ncbi:MAG: hypothetical protein GKC02_10570 [Methanomassiliicoccales archaeon]|nr:hypothetical protein [Methanomassiliicoccales archaeon]